MKKRNPMLKRAFEEAAKKELASLPEEKFVIRAYTPEFENKIQKIFDEKSEIKENISNTKRRKIKWSFLVAAALMCVLVIGVSAGEFIQTFSHEWRGRLTENIQNAAVGEGVEEFDAEYEKSTDPFAITGRQSGAGKHILLDYNQSIEYNDVVDEDEGYRFELTSITKARKKHRIMTGGRLSDGSATYEWTVSDGYYAIVEISKCDGIKLTQEEKDSRINVEWSFLLAGYSPSLTDLHFRGNSSIYSYCDDYKVYYAIEITDMMPFAGTDLALTAIEFESDGAFREINKDTLYADADGTLKLVNEDEYFGILLRFSVPEEFASEDEHYAEKYFELTPQEFDNWMNGYINPKFE